MWLGYSARKRYERRRRSRGRRGRCPDRAGRVLRAWLARQSPRGCACSERLRACPRRYSEKFIAKLTRSILRFISQCHAKGIIYRDVKPDNFLVRGVGRRQSPGQGSRQPQWTPTRLPTRLPWWRRNRPAVLSASGALRRGSLLMPAGVLPVWPRAAPAQFLRHDDESPLKATDFGLSIRHWPDEPKLTSRSGTPAYMVRARGRAVRAHAHVGRPGLCGRARGYRTWSACRRVCKMRAARDRGTGLEIEMEFIRWSELLRGLRGSRDRGTGLEAPWAAGCEARGPLILSTCGARLPACAGARAGAPVL